MKMRHLITSEVDAPYIENKMKLQRVCNFNVLVNILKQEA